MPSSRSDLAWKQAFAEAGLRVVHEQIQRGFPEGLYPVKMYVKRVDESALKQADVRRRYALQ